MTAAIPQTMPTPAAVDVLRHSQAIFDLQAQRDREIAEVRAKYRRLIAQQTADFAARFGFSVEEGAEVPAQLQPAVKPVQRLRQLRNEDLLAALRTNGPCGLEALALATMGRDDCDLRKVISSRMFTLVKQGRAVKVFRGVWAPVPEVQP